VKFTVPSIGIDHPTILRLRIAHHAFLPRMAIDG